MPQKIYSENSLLIERRIFGDFGIFVFDTYNIGKNALPGQFIMLKLDNEKDPLLARPFSIFYSENNRLALFIKKVGRTTSKLFSMNLEDRVKILGPLGNGFEDKKDKVILIGGGSGVAPLYFYARKYGFLRFIIGFPTYIKGLFEKYFEDAEIITEDGSYGKKGFPTDYIKDTNKEIIYACGPLPMLKALEEKRKYSLENTYVSLESMMGCGLGICAGCGVKRRKEKGYFRVCSDGPVFPFSLIAI